MKRIALLAAGLALVCGLAAGCSKASDVAVPNIDTNKITNDASKCTELATSYATLITPLMTGAGTDADVSKVQTSLDDLKSKVPDSVKAEVDTLANGVKNAKSPAEAVTFLSSADATKANKAITNYLTVECSKVGS